MPATAEIPRARTPRRDPRAEAEFQRGLTLAAKGRWAQAAQAFEQATRHEATEPVYWLNLADACLRLGEHERSARAARRACACGPLSELALAAAAHSLAMAQCHEEVVSLLRAQDLEHAQGPHLHFALGRSLLALDRGQEAVQALLGALQRQPHFIAAHVFLGNTFERMHLHEEARECFLTALELGGEAGELLSAMTHQDQNACRWDLLAQDSARLLPLLDSDAGLPAPFQLLTLDTRRDQQLAAARALHQARCGSICPLPRPRGRRAPGPIRVGYLSADLHRHATAYLMAEVFERHDPARVQAYAYSYGPDDGSAMRARIVQAFGGRLVDVRNLSDRAAAERIRVDAIDILVDLKGYTQGARPGIAALRPAAVQVNYLGFPGTLGSGCHDYIIGDAVVTPLDHANGYSECIAQLPDCYQPNDRSRAIGARPRREDCGLPATGFVFCSFNSNYKITAERFDAWCRLLAQVPGSVLWLYEANAQARAQLERAARQRGVDPGRLVFAPYVDQAEHLARLQLADLVVDTFPVTAHTTASDALWAGVPLVTQRGETFVSRVAASVLAAAGMGELACADAASYEALALDLARDPERLQALRERLRQAREVGPLFDSAATTRALEDLYERMLERHARGLPPAHLDAHGPAIAGQADPDAVPGVPVPPGGNGAAPGAPVPVAGRKVAPGAAPTRERAGSAADALAQGIARARGGDWDAAIECFTRACRADPRDALAALNLAHAHLHAGHPEPALEAARACLVLAPDNAIALDIAVQCLSPARRDREIVELCGRFDMGRISDARLHLQHGIALAHCWKHQQAVSALMQALGRDPALVEAHVELGSVFQMLQLHEEARECFRTAAALTRNNAPFLSAAAFASLSACSWDSLGGELAELRAAMHEDRGQPEPFYCLTLPTTRAEQLAAMRSFWRRVHAPHCTPLPPPARPHAAAADGRIRVGYLSSDLHSHATAFLLAGVFEQHDRSAFDVYAYSYGDDDGTPMRQRLIAAFGPDRFIDLREASDTQIAQRIRDDGIDVLVDLKGYTLRGRAGILGLRPAPVQVNYLGFPGTMGADCMDYIIGDPIVTPIGHAEDYAERIAQLPGCYQANDRGRAVAGPQSRARWGLPEDAFVFCSFNANYKITPEVFDIWCRLLAAVPDSVLWMLESNAQARRNLLAQARARGIDAGRLLWAPGIDNAQHLARISCADLFLDTLPVNAHTTASDALWAGLPVVTVLGETFVSRVAASILTAAGLPELVARDLQEYERLARELAADRARLQRMRAHLLAARESLPLFDTPRTTRALEDLYTRMVQRSRAGLPADHLPAGDAGSAWSWRESSR